MSDTVLLDVAYFMNAYMCITDKDNVLIVCSHLLRFSYEKGLLLVNPFDEQGNLKIETVIRESDLTALGKLIFNDLMYDWLTYADNESGKIDRKNNVKMLEKYFNKLSQSV